VAVRGTAVRAAQEAAVELTVTQAAQPYLGRVTTAVLVQVTLSMPKGMVAGVEVRAQQDRLAA
jgi:hypothetical protein